MLTTITITIIIFQNVYYKNKTMDTRPIGQLSALPVFDGMSIL